MTIFKKFLSILQQSMDGWIVNRILDTPINESSLTNSLLKARTLRDYFNDDLFTVDENADEFSKRTMYDRGRLDFDPLIGDGISRTGIHSARSYRGQSNHVLPSKMHDLHSEFRVQLQENEKSLSVLRQEERAIKDLLYQNSQEQAQINENQRALQGIDRRMNQIQSEAGQLIMRPTPNEYETRRRLHKLHDIPWRKSTSY